MTLPRGFGSSGTCYECGRPRKYGEICVCQTKSNDIHIPLTKNQFKLYVWYGLFWGLVILSIITAFYSVYFIVLVLFVFIIGSLVGAPFFNIRLDFDDD